MVQESVGESKTAQREIVPNLRNGGCMSKFEKLLCVGCPFVFGMVLVGCGLIIRSDPGKILYALMAICTGLVCMSIFSVCAVLIRILEK